MKENDNLFAEFKPTTYEEWHEEAVKLLKGAPFDKKMYTKTPEGITLKPIYYKEDMTFEVSLPGYDDYVRGISAEGNVEMSGHSAVDASGGSFGIRAGSGVTWSGYGDITAGGGSCGISAEGDVTMSGYGDVTATGDMAVSDSCGIRSERGRMPGARANCIFEHVYFSRPDSVVRGSSFYLMRHNMGRRLARETPVDADLVISVPDSGTPAAEGFAQELGIPFGTGLIKNRYVARTFIQPTQELRQMGVRLKLNALPDVVRGKRLVMVDDSIVRGTTSRQIVRMLKAAGATEVHVRSASPMVAWPCFYGIDTGSQDQLIAAQMSLDEIRAHIEADSVGFLSVEGLLACVPEDGYCTACFTGDYPVEIPRSWWEERFLPGREPNNLESASEASRTPLAEVPVE